MKIAGIICTVWASLMLVMLIIGLANNPQDSDMIARPMGSAIGLLVLGIFLIDRGNKKKKEKEDKEKWANGKEDQ